MPEEKLSSLVPFNLGNIKKCLCTQCPVQQDSTCSKNIMKKAKGIMAKNALPQSNEISKQYCAIGRSHCEDLDFKQTCICPSCPVWTRYALENASPNKYFCEKGYAGENK